MQTVVYSGEELTSLEEQWNILYNKYNASTFYNSYDFFKTWTGDIKDENIKIIVIKEGNSFLGLAAIILRRANIRSLYQMEYSFVDELDFFDVLVDSSCINLLSICKKIFQKIMSITSHRICFRKMPHDSTFVWYLLKSDRYNQYCRPMGENPYIEMQQWESFSSFKRRCLPKNINLLRNKLVREYDCEFKCYKGVEIPVDRLIDIYNLRNNNRTSKNIFSMYGKKLEELMKLEDSMCFCIILNGDIQCYIHSFYSNGILHNWNMAHNPEYDRGSIGAVLRYDFMKYVFDKLGYVKRIDWGGGRYYWKFMMTSDFKMTYEFKYNKKYSRLFTLFDRFLYSLRAFIRK
jgi:hypothetical protein